MSGFYLHRLILASSRVRSLVRGNLISDEHNRTSHPVEVG